MIDPPLAGLSLFASTEQRQTTHTALASFSTGFSSFIHTQAHASKRAAHARVTV